jgi:hypothetical protein
MVLLLWMNTQAIDGYGVVVVTVAKVPEAAVEAEAGAEGW